MLLIQICQSPIDDLLEQKPCAPAPHKLTMVEDDSRSHDTFSLLGRDLVSPGIDGQALRLRRRALRRWSKGGVHGRPEGFGCVVFSRGDAMGCAGGERCG